jgi:hypothetical protein
MGNIMLLNITLAYGIYKIIVLLLIRVVGIQPRGHSLHTAPLQWDWMNDKLGITYIKTPE